MVQNGTFPSLRGDIFTGEYGSVLHKQWSGETSPSDQGRSLKSDLGPFHFNMDSSPPLFLIKLKVPVFGCPLSHLGKLCQPLHAQEHEAREYRRLGVSDGKGKGRSMRERVG